MTFKIGKLDMCNCSNDTFILIDLRLEKGYNKINFQKRNGIKSIPHAVNWLVKHDIPIWQGSCVITVLYYIIRALQRDVQGGAKYCDDDWGMGRKLSMHADVLIGCEGGNRVLGIYCCQKNG